MAYIQRMYGIGQLRRMHADSKNLKAKTKTRKKIRTNSVNLRRTPVLVLTSEFL